ncbi:hypothetical protein [Neisseria gonorrhoeae]|uniref:hypothetical protein n=1 Tax=Neisseria gonorrhoeae TaxID=485 RepID=UPI001E419771|nr:hypothetical protein [Neisseria gonorrhoeae]
MNFWAVVPLRHLRAKVIMLKNEIRGGLGIPPDWATMRGQAKKTNVFADAEKRVFRREKRIVQHPLIRFPSV